MIVTNTDYNLSKPNVIGEYSQSGGDGRSITELQTYAYDNGYMYSISKAVIKANGVI